MNLIYKIKKIEMIFKIITKDIITLTIITFQTKFY